MPRLSPEEEQTISVYDMTASQWVTNHATESFWLPEISKFHNLIPSGKLLEIGSGGGRDANILSNLGYNYFGTDISSGLIEQAKDSNPSLNIVQSSIYEMPFSENTFDSFWASAVLLHIPKTKIGLALDSIHKVSKPDAVGFIAIKAGEGEKVEWDDRFFAYYTQEEFTDVLTTNNFNIIDSNSQVKGSTTWLTFLVTVQK